MNIQKRELGVKDSLDSFARGERREEVIPFGCRAKFICVQLRLSAS